jgi:hypothetical protein
MTSSPDRHARAGALGGDRRYRALLRLMPVLIALCAVATLHASVALAAPGAGWEVVSNARPTNLPPGGRGFIEIDVFNIGAGAPHGRVTVTDVLPAGVSATDAGALAEGEYDNLGTHIGLGRGIFPPGSAAEQWECSGTQIVTCTAEPDSPTFPVAGGGAGAGRPMFLGIAVTVAPGESEGAHANQVTVAGGGAPAPASSAHPLAVSSKPSGFAISNWDVWFSNEDGTIDTQAGSHPYAATFALDFATARDHEGNIFQPESEEEYLHSEAYKHDEPDIRGAIGGDPQTVEALLPPGLLGDPHAVPQCTRAQLNYEECPHASQVGIITVFTAGITVPFNLFNMVPPSGAAAEFGFSLDGIATLLDAGVRTGGDYGITTTVDNIPQRAVEGSLLTLWGYPADPSHDAWRPFTISGCDGSEFAVNEFTNCEPLSISGGVPKPFLTLPTSCGAPPVFGVRADTWQEPSQKAQASVLAHYSDGTPAGLTGCDRLAFDPPVSLAPDTAHADTPAGLTVEIKPPIGGLTEVHGLSTADIQNTKVVLPKGVVINPGQAAGLVACPRSEDGLEPLANGEEDNGSPSCPAASKVGTVSIETPLLTDRLEGNVYVLQSNPPHLELLLSGYADGVNLKLIGHVDLDEATGQLTSTFDGTPELPFTDFKLSFSGGAQAALATPTQCGTYTSTADFTPWSSPFGTDALQASSFAITSGSNGAPCPPSPLPFSPNLIAGATTDQAGGFTSFSLLLRNGEDQQRIQALRFKVPEGLSGMISKVPLCGEPQAAEGKCPAASQIGHTVVQSGPGAYPLVIPEPGKSQAPIYLTGPYKGAPFGLSIVVPVEAGPFDLGTVVTRAKIEVDPNTAQITVATDPLPQIIAGVPTDLRLVNAVIDREGFMFNPTNCDPMSFSGTATGSEGASVPIASHFQVGSCQSLKFQPKLAVSATGRVSRANGTAVTFKLSYPAGAQGAQANLGRFKVELPKRLPARLSTLQKACAEVVFAANPAGCPAAADVGHATVRTPLLPGPLTGPAYFVSHGGAKFPELVLVLQGDGVTIDVHVETFISKQGITSGTVKAVPDAPFSSFELTLPAGPFSEFTSVGSPCKGTLQIPTEMIGQNGSEIHQKTKIAVTGCPKAKPVKRAKRQAVHKVAKRNARKTPSGAVR